MYAYAYVCVCMHMYMCAYVCICMQMYAYVCICMYCMFNCLYSYVYKGYISYIFLKLKKFRIKYQLSEKKHLPMEFICFKMICAISLQAAA